MLHICLLMVYNLSVICPFSLSLSPSFLISFFPFPFIRVQNEEKTRRTTASCEAKEEEEKSVVTSKHAFTGAFDRRVLCIGNTHRKKKRKQEKKKRKKKSLLHRSLYSLVFLHQLRKEKRGNRGKRNLQCEEDRNQ